MDNLSPFLKNQYAAQKEQALSQLKNAYDKNVQAIDEKSASIPAQYETAKNEVAAQNAIAKKNFNEQAAATGLNSGTSGQAELARSNAYMSALSNLNRSEADAQQALERDRLNLQVDYENAIAAQNAANSAALNSALYEEMIRQQNADRADAQWQAQFDESVRQYEKDYEEALRRYNQEFAFNQQNANKADAQWQAQFNEAIRQYEKDYEENLRRYNQEYAFNQQKYMDAMGGNSSGSNSSGSTSGGGNTQAGYDTHGYTTEEIKAMQDEAGITVDGIWGPDTQAAYDAGYRPSVKRRQEELGGAYGTTAEIDVAKMISNGASESAIFSYIDELTHAKYLTPSENTTLKLKYRQGKIGTN